MFNFDKFCFSQSLFALGIIYFYLFDWNGPTNSHIIMLYYFFFFLVRLFFNKILNLLILISNLTKIINIKGEFIAITSCGKRVFSIKF